MPCLPNSPNARDVLTVVREWLTINAPGCKLEYISVHARPLKRPIRLVASPALRIKQDTREQVASDHAEKGPGLPEPVRDILRVLRETGRPLTLTRMLEEMGKRDIEWSDRTILRHLAVLMSDGTVENPEDARPRGYRLVEDADTP